MQIGKRALTVGNVKILVPYWIEDYYIYAKNGVRKRDELLAHFGNIHPSTLGRYSKYLREVLRPTSENLVIIPDPQGGGGKNSDHLYFITNKISIKREWEIDNELHTLTRIRTCSNVGYTNLNGLSEDDPARAYFELSLYHREQSEISLKKSLDILKRRRKNIKIAE